MGIEVLTVEQRVARDVPYRDDPGYLRHVQSDAARELGEEVLAKAAKYRKIEPTEDDPVTRHRWTIGVERDMSVIEARERQMEQAYRDGMRAAAVICRRTAALYARAEGPCGPVIGSALSRAAKEIESAAHIKQENGS